LAFQAGCRTEPTVPLPTTTVEKPPTGEPAKLLAIWSDGVLRESDRPVASGFIGRVYLLDAQSKLPITIPGEFKFYAFEAKPGADAVGALRIHPDRQWEFESEEAASRLWKDALGWGYTFWLPWGGLASQDRTCSVMVRFTPQQGKTLVSDASLVTLPGMHESKVLGPTRRVEQSADAATGNLRSAVRGFPN
jgi:hypothetical protein